MPYIQNRGRGMGDDIIDAAEAPTIAIQADPQTAYMTCLRGGGSFASCNQIPGVTEEMIAAAKAQFGTSIKGRPTDGLANAYTMPFWKLAVIIAAGGLALHLLTK